MNKESIARVIGGFVIIGVIVWSGYLFITNVLPSWAEHREAVKLEIQAKFDAVKALSIDEQSKLSKVCIDGGLVPKLVKKYKDGYRTDYKIVSVECEAPPQPKSVGDGVSDAAVTAGAVYLGGKILDAGLR